MICTPGTMLFLLRARPRLGILCRSCYFHHASRDSSMVRAFAKRETCIGWKKTELLIPARYFAAPVLPKPKPVKEKKGPLLNNEITAKVVRLVTDDGHAVVSTREALDRALKLKLDLVQVESKANPPVCKIMDFHKEKYKQQLKDKERAKKKSGGSMRKGVVKEVRFSIKTETKDLHMKADMIRRLMERGYPVKCMAVGAEDQDLGELLSRIVPLIEDISVIEAPPRVGRGQAHMVVRHAKFGSPKKSGKKASNVVEPIRNVSQTAASLQPLVEEEEEEDEEEGAEEEEEEEEEEGEEEEEEEEDEEEEVVEQEDEKEEEVEERVPILSRLETKNANLIGQRVHNVKEIMEKPPADSVWSTFNTADNSAEIFDFEEFGTGIGEGFSSDVSSSRISNESTTPSGVPSPEVDSRAKTWAGKDGEEPTNRIFTPGWIPSRSEQSVADKIRSAGKNEYPSNHRLPQKNVIPQPPANQNRKSGFNANQEQSPPTSPGPTLSSYGIFSAKKTADSIDQKNPAENSRISSNLIQNSKLKGGLTPNSLEFKGDGRTDKDIQGGWGQFSKPTSNSNQHRSSPAGHTNTRR